MELSEITREPVLAAVLDESDELVLNLLADASTVLGYNHKPQKLGAALCRLGIEVLNKEQVDWYKEQKAHSETIQRMKAYVAANSSNSFWRSEWQCSKIESYTKPIPEFALSKAIQIKRAVPEVKISILELGTDPFMIVELFDESHSKYSPLESYYIECWHEPTFEGRSNN